jgi:hypothetical protein
MSLHGLKKKHRRKNKPAEVQRETAQFPNLARVLSANPARVDPATCSNLLVGGSREEEKKSATFHVQRQ